jgi:NDP-sugar pyrophosphorylase family protein
MLKNIGRRFSMHIVIPMSGVGNRFVTAGYAVPKPLIEIDGKPIIQHVTELFRGESKFTFICNQDHLNTTNMREILSRIVPQANIICIPNHKMGPVFAVTQILDLIEDDEEVIVSYCDFGTWWDYSDFLNHTRERNADGAIPAYKGFHPHMIGSTNYAFMRDKNQWMLEIKEKESFTDNRRNEFASNGIYYFKKGSHIKRYFPLLMEKNIDLNGEFYVSLIYNLLISDGLSVSIYDVQHMLQWGTPQDVQEYQAWSNYFMQVVLPQGIWEIEKGSTTLIPLAGLGSRFVKEGYLTPKPLLDVSGKLMVIQANSQLPTSEYNNYVCLKDHIERYAVDVEVTKVQSNAEISVVSSVTEGQAISCEVGIKNVSDDKPLLIGACDNGMLWDHNKYRALINNSEIDAIVWTVKGHPSSRINPNMYGWVEVSENDNSAIIDATAISVKKAISDSPVNDHAIVGTFYFRQASIFKQGLKILKDKNIRVNNEFYVDSLMAVLIDIGLKVVVFEVDAYVGWGTPDDYETFRYWQSFFHKNSNHPYIIENDFSVNMDKVEEIKDRFYRFRQEYR